MDRAQQAVARLREGGWTLATAESLTGGMLGERITGVSGSSAVYRGGVVSYCNEIKHQVLGVSDQDLRTLGAVSEPVARQMAQQEHSHATCLKGMYALITGHKAIVPPPTVSDDPPDIVLRRCYGREMRSLTQYESRQSDPQYGHVFRSLAQDEQAHCHRILEILGALAK